MDNSAHRSVRRAKLGLVHDIDSALKVIHARDATAARLARGLWGALRIGAAHLTKITQYDVQGICWGALPLATRTERSAAVIGDPHAAAALLGELLELLGYPRYAEICRGQTTRAILDAAGDADACAALVAEAWRDSGVKPPDTPLLAWGGSRGPIEQVVHAGAGRILEEAITAGVIDLRGADVEVRRANLVMRLLASPAENLPGSWYTQIFDERLSSWLTSGGSQTRRELLVRTRPEVARAPGDSECPVLPAVATLLHAGRGAGIRLTRNGYLPTALVRELVGLLPACADHQGGRGESSWPPLGALRYLLDRMDLLRRNGNRLVLTQAGTHGIEEPEYLVECVGMGLVGTDTSIRGVIEEAVFAALLLEDVALVNGLLDKAGTVVEEEGWDASNIGTPVIELAREYAWQFVHRLYVLDVVHTSEDRRHVGLTEAGRAVARFGLRARVMLREVPG